jgi:hypothetical protein
MGRAIYLKETNRSGSFRLLAPFFGNESKAEDEKIQQVMPVEKIGQSADLSGRDGQWNLPMVKPVQPGLTMVKPVSLIGLWST